MFANQTVQQHMNWCMLHIMPSDSVYDIKTKTHNLMVWRQRTKLDSGWYSIFLLCNNRIVVKHSFFSEIVFKDWTGHHIQHEGQVRLHLNGYGTVGLLAWWKTILQRAWQRPKQVQLVCYYVGFPPDVYWYLHERTVVHWCIAGVSMKV